MTRNYIIATAMGVVCTALPFAAQFYGDRSGGWLMVDFRAYYCAASAVARGANPYFTASIHACESNASPPFYRALPNVTVPAPYPPYVFALLYPLTALPFGTAAVVWWAFLAFCILGAAYALSRVTRQPLLVGWAALALALGLTSFSSGNMVTLGVAAVVAAALSAQLGSLSATALAVTVAMVEPQLALPAAVAVFARFPRIRWMLVLLFAVLGMVTLAVVGPARSLAYLTSVVPAHALSEVSRDNQYSLSTVVSALGVPDAQAVIVGSVSYIIMMLIGVVVAQRLAKDYHDPAFTLLVPPTFALLGGSFVHTGEIAIAAPACLLLFVRAERHRGLLLAIVVLLAIPWMLATSASLLLAPLFPAAYLVYVLGGRDRTLALASAVGSLLVLGSLFLLAHHPAPPPVAVHNIAQPPIDPRLAEASWRTFVLGNSTNRLIMWLLRLPTWIGLVSFAAAAFALIYRRRIPQPI